MCGEGRTNVMTPFPCLTGMFSCASRPRRKLLSISMRSVKNNVLADCAPRGPDLSLIEPVLIAERKGLCLDLRQAGCTTPWLKAGLPHSTGMRRKKETPSSFNRQNPNPRALPSQ